MNSDDARRSAHERHDRIPNAVAIDALRVSDGTLVTVATLDLPGPMRGRGTKVVSVRIKAEDGRSLSVRLGPVNARHFAVALARGIEALGDFEGEFVPRPVRPKSADREAPALPGSSSPP